MLGVRKSYLLVFLVGLIVLAGAVLRFWGIVHGSFAFTFDVGRDLSVIYEIISTKKLTLLGPTTGLPGVFYGPWWYYFLIIPFVLSAGNPYVVVSSIAFMGLLAVILFFFLGSVLWGRKIGLLLSCFISLSFGFVSSSSQIWSPNLIQFFLPAAIFFLWKVREKENLLSAVLFGVLSGLTFEMEPAFGIFFLFGITISFFLFIINSKFRVRLAISWFLGLFFIFLPRILFDLRHQFLMSKNLMAFFSNPVPRQVPLNFGERVVNRAYLFFEQWSETFGAGNNLVGIVFLAIVIIGLWKIRKTLAYQTKSLFLISIVPVITLYVGFVFYPDTVWSYYLIGLPIFYILFVFSIFAQLFSTFKRGRMVLWAIMITIVILNLRPVMMVDSFRQPNFEGDAAVFRNQLGVVDYVYKEANGKPFNQTAYTPPVIDYTWRYLFIWYGQKKYGYQPSKEKTSDFYVIMEPDVWHPERLTKWLEDRKGDGRIIKEEKLRGGITVQTRIH